MKFARVQGHGHLDDVTGRVVLVVSLDSGHSASVIRDELVDWLDFGPPGDVAWQIDQYTQETIGNLLADQGWEPVSEDTSQRGLRDDGLVHSATYVVRKMSVYGRAGDSH